MTPTVLQGASEHRQSDDVNMIIAVFRGLLTLEGTLAVLAPDFNMIDEARIQAADWLRESLAPGTLGHGIVDKLLESLPVRRRLPSRIDRIASALEQRSQPFL